MHVKSWCLAKPITFCRCRCPPRYLSPLIFNILVSDSSFCFFSRFLLFYFVLFELQGSAVSSSTFRTFQSQSQMHNITQPSLRPGFAVGERRRKKKTKKMARAKISAWIHSPIFFCCCLTMFLAFSVSPHGYQKLMLPWNPSLIPGWNLPWITRLIPHHKIRPLYDRRFGDSLFLVL